MTSLRSTRSKSTVAEPSDAATDESIWRRIFATFLADASSALVSHSAPRASHSYFYLPQSDGRNSMCLLTGLDCETYSALLLKCRLISIRNNTFTRRKRKKSKRDLEHEAKRQVKEEKREIAFLLEDLNLPADSDLTKVREDLECDDGLVEMEELLELEKQLFDEGSNGDNMCA